MSALAGGLTRPPLRRIGIAWRGMAALGAAACATALLVAHGSETFLGFVPCAFCLLERVPYEAGIAIGLAGVLTPSRVARWLVWTLVAVLLGAGLLSFVHVGVEQHWWPDPLPACTVPHFSGMTAAQRLMAMPARPAKPCEDPDYLIPGLPISMAQMGCVYALAVCACLAISAYRIRERRI